MNDAAVLSQSARFVVLHTLAAADIVDKLDFLIGQVWRDDTQDRLPDDFLRGVSEDPLGSRIPARYDAFEILRNDGVIGVLNNGRKMLLREFRRILATPWHEA